MSLKTIPGFGKSGMSRIFAARSGSTRPEPMRRASGARARRAPVRAPARRHRAPRAPRARDGGDPDCRAESRSDQLSEKCRLAVGVGAELPQVSRGDAEPAEFRQPSRPRCPARGTGSPQSSIRGSRSPYSSSSRTNPHLSPPARRAFPGRARSRPLADRLCPAPPLPFHRSRASSSWRMTRSGRNSSRWSRRIVRAALRRPRCTAGTRLPSAAGSGAPDPRGSGSSRSRCLGTRREVACGPPRS